MKGIFSKNGVSLDRLHTLGEVIQSGSFALAAKGDPTKASLISRQMGELEKALGVPLLDQTRQPTLAARRLAESCERFIREVEQVSMEAQGQRRPITVGAGEVVRW